MPEFEIVITNDDGIAAPGLTALADAVASLGKPIIVAPAFPSSQCSHSVTTGKKLMIQQLRPDCYSVEGTPADCVRLALAHLAPKARWVVSGVNQGGNLGGDIWVSGTVAAAREASLRGVHAVAISQYRRAELPDCWQTSSRRTAAVLQDIFQRQQEPYWFWNVNLPAQPPEVEPPIHWCEADSLPLPIGYEQSGASFRYVSSYHNRPRTPGHDVDLCFSGGITISRLTARWAPGF